LTQKLVGPLKIQMRECNPQLQLDAVYGSCHLGSKLNP
jgi:hypothetical protein